MPAAKPGDRLLGRYRVRRELGRGAMGRVLLAVDESLDREVAIKVVLGREGESAQAPARLEREARAAAGIEHPGVVQVHDVRRTEDGAVFVVMERVRGRSLRDIMAEGILDRAERQRIIDALADAIDAAHACGVVHRDIKPDNVMVTDEGRVVLLDFGLGKRSALSLDGERTPDRAELDRLTESGAILGTPAYVSPEQIRGRHGPSADRWSLAVLAYELYTGRLPWDAEDVAPLLALILTESPAPPSSHDPTLGSAVDAVFAKALASDPAARHATGRELADALRRAETTGGRGTGRRPAFLAALLLGLVSVVGVGATLWPEPPDPSTAHRIEGRGEAPPAPPSDSRWERVAADLQFSLGLGPLQRLADGDLLLRASEGLIRIPPDGMPQPVPEGTFGFFSDGSALQRKDGTLLRAGASAPVPLGLGDPEDCRILGVDRFDRVFCVDQHAVRLWDADRGSRTVFSSVGKLYGLSVSPSGRRLLVAFGMLEEGDRRDRFALVDLASGEVRERPSPPGYEARGDVTAILLDDTRVLYLQRGDPRDRARLAVVDLWEPGSRPTVAVELAYPYAVPARVEGTDVYLIRPKYDMRTLIRDLDDGETVELEVPFNVGPLGWGGEGLWLARGDGVDRTFAVSARPYAVVESRATPAGDTIQRAGHALLHIFPRAPGPWVASFVENDDEAWTGTTHLWRASDDDDLLEIPQSPWQTDLACGVSGCFLTRGGARVTLSSIDLDGGELREVASWPMSPVGSSPALAVVEDRAFVADGHRVREIDLASGETVKACLVGAEAQAVFIAARSTQEIYVAALQLEAPWALARVRWPDCEVEVIEKDPVRLFANPVLSPDRNRLAFLRIDAAYELWRLPGALAGFAE